jgi:hypothetical protein
MHPSGGCIGPDADVQPVKGRMFATVDLMLLVAGAAAWWAAFTRGAHTRRVEVGIAVVLTVATGLLVSYVDDLWAWRNKGVGAGGGGGGGGPIILKAGGKRR